MTNATLSLNHQQLLVIEQALDLYARVGLGQLEALEHLVLDKTIPVKRNISLTAAADETLTHCIALKSKLGFLSTVNYGIHNPNVSENVREAFKTKKIIEVRRKQLPPPEPTVKVSNRALIDKATEFLKANPNHLDLELKNPSSQPAEMVIAFRDHLACHNELGEQDHHCLSRALIFALDQFD